jgi:glucokinase
MAEAGEDFRSRIEGYVKKFGLPHPARSVKISLAKLGSDAGFIGAAGCARMLTSTN